MFNLKEFLGLAYYTSGLDQFLNNYDKTHPRLSESQRKERAKYDRIYALRDHETPVTAEKKFWDKF